MNGLRSAFHQVIAGRPRGAGQKLLGVFLKIASVGYGAAVGLVRAYEKSALRSRALPCPVISVGNLTWGGTGKTPFTIYLAERFLRQGIRAAVLTRGYGQDEVDLLRRQLPQVPVYVGRDRIQTGHRAIQKGAQVLILDDGFQHWRLRRDLDIVLLNAAAPFGNGWMLPGGVLREGPASLGRAGVVVLSKDDPASRNVAALEARVRRFNPDALLLSAQLKPECFEVWGQDRRQPLAEWNGTRAGIFSGIADPAAFEQSLRQLGVTPVFHKKFLDHHRYEKQAIDRLVLECQRLNAVALMTTLKDAVRIPQEWLKNLPVPVVVLHVNLELTREEDLIERLHSVLGR